MPTCWRIASPQYSTTPEQMLDGEGAYLFGGRWNSKGVRVVYLGSSIAQAAMELLVHIKRSQILNTYNKLQVEFDESLVEHIDLSDLPDDWASPTMASSVMAVGDQWVANQSSVILQVPSAVIHGESNFLFNPQHPDASQVVVGPITPFDYDPRLADE